MIKRLIAVLLFVQIGLSSVALVFARHTHTSLVIAQDGIDRHAEQLLLSKGTAVLVEEVMVTQRFWLFVSSMSSLFSGIGLLIVFLLLSKKIKQESTSA